MHLVIFSHSLGTAENKTKIIQKDTILMLLRANLYAIQKIPIRPDV